MSKTPERLAYEAWYRKQFDSTMYCESTWRGWEAGRAALTQAADAGAAESVDTFPEILAESEDAEHIIIARGEVQYICSCGQWCGTFATVTPAMIDWQEHAKTGHTLPLDYLAGHADALVWAAEVAEASDPRTGDWLYDDRNDLANALRKGPEMPPAPPAQQLQQAVARAIEKCAVICEGMHEEDRPGDYAAAIRAAASGADQGDDHAK